MGGVHRNVPQGCDRVAKAPGTWRHGVSRCKERARQQRAGPGYDQSDGIRQRRIRRLGSCRNILRYRAGREQVRRHGKAVLPFSMLAAQRTRTHSHAQTTRLWRAPLSLLPPCFSRESWASKSPLPTLRPGGPIGNRPAELFAGPVGSEPPADLVLHGVPGVAIGPRQFARHGRRGRPLLPPELTAKRLSLHTKLPKAWEDQISAALSGWCRIHFLS